MFGKVKAWILIFPHVNLSRVFSRSDDSDDQFTVNFYVSHVLFQNSVQIFVQVFLVTESLIWVVVSNIFYVHPYLGKIPILTNIFQMG